MKSVLNQPELCNEEAAIAYVEARLWPDGAVCPHCGTIGEATKLKGKTTRAGLWNCRPCRKPFTVRMGTVFESSHVPLRIWLQAIYLVCSSKKGISTRQLQRTLSVGMKTAWFLGHRIREMMKRDDVVPPLGGNAGTLEADVTYVGRKPGTKVRHGAGHMNPVFALVERDGEVRSFHVPNITGETLHSVIAQHAERDSHFMT